MDRMSDAHINCHPRLTIVAGRPGAGKTTLAHALARAIRCPVISRDEIKEGVVNSLAPGTPLTDAIQRHSNDVFFQTIELLLRRGVTLVAEAAFQHKVWAPRLEPLFAIACVSFIVCTVDPTLAHSRQIARGLADPERERFHGDAPALPANESSYDPPHFDVPTLVVDTTDGYQPTLEAIVAFAGGPRLPNDS